MRKVLFQKRQSSSAHEGAYRRKAVYLSNLWTTFPMGWSPKKSWRQSRFQSKLSSQKSRKGAQVGAGRCRWKAETKTFIIIIFLRTEENPQRKGIQKIKSAAWVEDNFQWRRPRCARTRARPMAFVLWWIGHRFKMNFRNNYQFASEDLFLIL